MAFKEADKGPINIGFKWNEYYQKDFFNNICLWNLNTLLQIGGYSNQIWGSGCDGKILYHRYIKYLMDKKKQSNIYIPILNTNKGSILEGYELNTWEQIIDPQYQHLKILADWVVDKYDDISSLNKYLSSIIHIKNRKGTQCNDSRHSHTHDIINDFDETNNEFTKKDKSYLKILDKHQHQKEVEHYTFKLISHLEKDIIE